MLPASLFYRSSLPSPLVSAEQAAGLLKDYYDLTGSIQALGSQQDRNFRVDTGQRRYVLKICHGDYATQELQAQHGALAHLAGQPGLRVPAVIPAASGQEIIALTLDGQAIQCRLLEYIDGQPLTGLLHLPHQLVAAFGALCAEADIALADYDHPGLARRLQWDPRHANRIVTHLLPIIVDETTRASIETVVERAWKRLSPLQVSLLVQAIHLDITDDNVVWARDAQREWQVQGIIDFGDLVRSWRIADLSVTCAALLHHANGDPFFILPAVQAYHQLNPLSREELQALWPLIVLRAAVLVLSSEQQISIDPLNHYARDNLAHEWEIFEVATSVPLALMEAALLAVAGQMLEPLASEALVPLLPGLATRHIEVLDLGVLSEQFEGGNWLEADIDSRLLATARGAGASVSRYGEYRLSRTRINHAEEPQTFALHVQMSLPQGLVVQAPFAGRLHVLADGAAQLDGKHLSLKLWGLNCDADGPLRSGQSFGTVSPDERLLVQLSRHLEMPAPLFVKPSHAAAWRQLCPSPAALLGVACDAPALDEPALLLARRDASLARSQKHYYSTPPRIERGWRNHLIDLQGRSYLDMLNNVAVLGHGHPRMAAVARRQWSLLNTNSRFNYSAITELSERLLALAPGSMDRVFLVNSGTEANDLAIRLAWAYSGGQDMLSVLEAYHGWSVATDAVSTSIADNPQALSTRPDWVHPVTAPNTFRGPYRGADSANDYLRSVDDALGQLADRGRQVAGFICEAVYGNAGGISLPDGYLSAVYQRIRAQGGVCIADEVQVGYGRLGEYFWGFEQQGVVPDIITVAKAMGNGHPLGAVITRREIAEALEAQGYFFSSAGGSPVSCRIGLEVLDVMRDEGLQDNARQVGAHFKARLEALMIDHRLIGAVHGMGLYLGLELVRDRRTLEPASEETTLLCNRLRELGIFMQPTGDHLNILKVKPPMCTDRSGVDFFVDQVAEVLTELEQDFID